MAAARLRLGRGRAAGRLALSGRASLPAPIGLRFLPFFRFCCGGVLFASAREVGGKRRRGLVAYSRRGQTQTTEEQDGTALCGLFCLGSEGGRGWARCGTACGVAWRGLGDSGTPPGSVR